MIVYDPNALLKKIAPEKKIKKLMKENISLKKTALSFIDDIDFIDKKSVAKVALKTIKAYQERIAKAQVDAGFEKSAAASVQSEIVDDPALLIQRVQNEIVFQVSQEIKSSYQGESYEWLPSEADEPDPEHQLNYGKVFVIGQGEMPGERYGCKCGMNILVNQTELNLG